MRRNSAESSHSAVSLATEGVAKKGSLDRNRQLKAACQALLAAFIVTLSFVLGMTYDLFGMHRESAQAVTRQDFNALQREIALLRLATARIERAGSKGPTQPADSQPGALAAERSRRTPAGAPELQGSPAQSSYTPQQAPATALESGGGAAVSRSAPINARQSGAPIPRVKCPEDLAPVEGTREVNAQCTSAGTFKMLVHGPASKPDVVSMSIINTQCWERDIIRSMESFLGSRSRLVVDVGANIGTYTASLAHLGHRVIAVEPFNVNVPLLRATLCNPSHNLMDRVSLYKVALDEKDIGEELCISATSRNVNNGNGAARRMEPGGRVPERCQEVVPTTTLDRLLLEVHSLRERPALMKMDIEGFETLALRGAPRLLGGSLKPCRIWFEHLADVAVRAGAANGTEMFEILSKAGYKVFTKRGEQVYPPKYGPDGDYYAMLEVQPQECVASGST